MSEQDREARVRANMDRYHNLRDRRNSQTREISEQGQFAGVLWSTSVQQTQQIDQQTGYNPQAQAAQAQQSRSPQSGTHSSGVKNVIANVVDGVSSGLKRIQQFFTGAGKGSGSNENILSNARKTGDRNAIKLAEAFLSDGKTHLIAMEGCSHCQAHKKLIQGDQRSGQKQYYRLGEGGQIVPSDASHPGVIPDDVANRIVVHTMYPESRWPKIKEMLRQQEMQRVQIAQQQAAEQGQQLNVNEQQIAQLVEHKMQQFQQEQQYLRQIHSLTGKSGVPVYVRDCGEATYAHPGRRAITDVTESCQI